MKGIWPDKIELRADKIGKDKWRMIYVEMFAESVQGFTKEQTREGIENAIKLLEKASKNFFCIGGTLKVDRLTNGLRVVIKGSREDVYGFLVSEFLPKSNLGKITLEQMWMFMALGAGLMDLKSVFGEGV